MKEYDTLSELQGSTQATTGLRLYCRENLYYYIVQASGYVATGDDVTFANGRVGKAVDVADAKYIKTVGGNVQDDIDSIIAGSLPSQAGNEFKFLTTNGTSASWFQGTLQMDTFANLQTFSPTVDGTTFICQERANARYILQTSGYVALPGDVTFANGRVGALQVDGPLNVKQMGAVADWNGSTGTDNYQVFMDAKERSNHVFVPDGSYAYSRGLRMDKFDFKWECESPATLMYCTGNAGAFTRWPEYSSVIMGTYTTANIGRNTKYSLNSVTVGESVTLSTPSDDSNFNIGDVVFITSTSTYTIGSETRPIWGQLNEVTGVSSGVISLKYVTEETGSAEISNMTSGTSSYILADGTDTGTANFASKNVEIIGGTWVSGKEEAPFSGGGGSLNCVVDIHSSECRNGPAYGNLYGYCSIRVNSEYDRKSPVELAYCSHGNNVDIGYSGVINPTTLSVTSNGFIWINESSRGNNVSITSANSANFDTDSLIKFTASRNNSVNIGSTYGENITESVIDFQDAAYTGVRPNTENNTACIMSNFADAPSGIRFRGNGQEGKNTASLTSAGSHTQAIYFDSSSGSKVINSSIPSGGVLMSSSSNVCVHDSYIGDGLMFGGDADSEISGSFSGIETDSSRLLKGCSLISLTSSATNASPYTKTRTVAAGALNEMDKIAIEFDCFIPNGESADNKTFTLSFAGTNILNRVTTTANDEVMIRGYITYASNTAAIANFIVYEGNAVVDARVLTIGNLDLASNNYDIVMTVTPINVSDTLNIRNYRIKPYSANAGEF